MIKILSKILIRGFGLIFLLLLVGTVFYTVIEGLSISDSFYFAGSALTASGYGEGPTTNTGKIFTVIYTLVGIGTLFFILGKLFHIIFQKTMLDPVFHERHQLSLKRKFERHSMKK